MFGLTRREQRWKAEQKAAESLVVLAVAAMNARARIAEAESRSDEVEALRAEIAELRDALKEKTNV